MGRKRLPKVSRDKEGLLKAKEEYERAAGSSDADERALKCLEKCDLIEKEAIGKERKKKRILPVAAAVSALAVVVLTFASLLYRRA